MGTGILARNTRKIRNVSFRLFGILTMSHIKAKDTKPELKIRQFLFSKGFRFRKNDKRLPGTPDIVLTKYKTVIFVNGCFWHVHENCKYFTLPKSNSDFWKQKLQDNKERDERVYRKNRELGWNVIIVWQCEIKGKLFLPRMERLIQQIREQN